MKPEIKPLWIAALRSGEYKQAVGALKTKCGYCCLGVLCDLYLKHVPINDRVTKDWSPLREVTGYYDFGNNTGILPEEVATWAGLTQPIMVDTKSKGLYVSNLTQLNDHFRLNFNEIADIIEKEL